MPLLGLLEGIAAERGMPGLRLEPDSAPGWVGAGRPFLEEMVRGVMNETGADRRVGALLAWKRYSYWVTFPVALGWALNRRVPLVEVQRVMVDVRGPRIALAHDVPVAVLAHDPGAGIAGTVVADDERALLDLAREALIVGHLAPVAAALRRLVPVGERVIWGSVAAALAQPLVAFAERLPGDPLTEVPALVEGIDPALGRLVDLVAVRGSSLSLRRRTCCLAFAVPGLDECQACPRRWP